MNIPEVFPFALEELIIRELHLIFYLYTAQQLFLQTMPLRYLKM